MTYSSYINAGSRDMSRDCELPLIDENGDELDEDCQFSGDIDVHYDGWEMFWTCPLCGREHQEVNPDY